MPIPSLIQPLQIPLGFDYSATFLYAIAGSWLALQRGYDIVGVITVAFASAVGGGLLRDGLFLQQGPPMVTTDDYYLVLVVVGALVGIVAQRWMRHSQRTVELIDALGLGAYAVVGMQKALTIGMSLPAVILVGLVNAVGGGILRDVLIRQEPWMFRPAQFYAATVFVGCIVFLVLGVGFHMQGTWAGLISITVTFTLRALSIVFNWRTTPIADESVISP